MSTLRDKSWVLGRPARPSGWYGAEQKTRLGGATPGGPFVNPNGVPTCTWDCTVLSQVWQVLRLGACVAARILLHHIIYHLTSLYLSLPFSISFAFTKKAGRVMARLDPIA